MRQQITISLTNRATNNRQFLFRSSEQKTLKCWLIESINAVNYFERSTFSATHFDCVFKNKKKSSSRQRNADTRVNASE